MKVIRPKRGVSADTFALRRKEEGFLIENTVLNASTRTAFICYDHAGPAPRQPLPQRPDPTSRRGPCPTTARTGACAGYDMVGTVFHGVEITGFGKVTPHHDEGHALYLNLAGDLTLIDCDIHDNGGQGLQAVNPPERVVAPQRPRARHDHDPPLALPRQRLQPRPRRLPGLDLRHGPGRRARGRRDRRRLHRARVARRTDGRRPPDRGRGLLARAQAPRLVAPPPTRPRTSRSRTRTARSSSRTSRSAPGTPASPSPRSRAARS